ncbi:hypothetical protein DH2020_013570 [Rehmannia glutinosa]|uniref:SAP domain-containing protein n=1 Tax=Rehmannia glutinosa TaxID=99300 RepID=A0ABR0X571_REHGL
MDGGSSTSSPSDLSNAPTAFDGGASRFLANLPSRGNFSSTVLSTNPVITTNQTNILIRSLMLQKSNSSSKDGKNTSANPSSRKRPAEKALVDKAAGKKAMSSTELDSSQEAYVIVANSFYSISSSVTKLLLCTLSLNANKDLQSLTVQRLRALLKEKGLSTKGRKASASHILLFQDKL